MRVSILLLAAALGKMTAPPLSFILAVVPVPLAIQEISFGLLLIRTIMRPGPWLHTLVHCPILLVTPRPPVVVNLPLSTILTTNTRPQPPSLFKDKADHYQFVGRSPLHPTPHPLNVRYVTLAWRNRPLYPIVLILVPVPVCVLRNALVRVAMNSICLLPAINVLLPMVAFTRQITDLIVLIFLTIIFPVQLLGQFPEVSIIFIVVWSLYLTVVGL